LAACRLSWQRDQSHICLSVTKSSQASIVGRHPHESDLITADNYTATKQNAQIFADVIPKLVLISTGVGQVK